jgi:hypothetical protein
MTKEPWEKVQEAVDVVHCQPTKAAPGGRWKCGSPWTPAGWGRLHNGEGGWDLVTCRLCLTLASRFIGGAKAQLAKLDKV